MNSSNDNRQLDRQHEPFEKRARELWCEAARQIDPGTASHLRAARRQALQEVRRPRPHAARWLIPTGAVAAVALAAMMVWQPLPRAPSMAQGHVSTSVLGEPDAELPPNAEQVDPALYQNLDFYAWLAANDKHSATH
jgi:ferric-dicitrate binding protein FerR (iron transport regulator)